MPNQLHTNNDQFDSLLQKKLAAVRAKAPKELWSAIEEKLAQSEQSDLKLDHHLQEQFKNFNCKAPTNLWHQIQANLGSLEGSEEINNRLLEDKIRSSYQLNSKAPEQVWYNVNKQLNIDSIWESMQPTLKNGRTRYIRYKRLRQLMVAASLLLLLRGCGFNLGYWMESQNHTKHALVPAASKHDPTLSTITKQYWLKEQAASTLLPSITTKTNENRVPSSLEQVKGRFKAPSQNEPQEETKDHSNLKKQTIAITKITPSHSRKNEALIEKELNIKKENILQYKSSELAVIQAKFITLPEYSIQKHINNELLPSQKAAVVSYTEVGFIASITPSMQTNKVIQKSIKGSVPQKIQLTPNFGFFVAHHFNSRHSINFELWLNKKVKHTYYQYNSYKKTSSQHINLNYIKLASSYRYSLYTYQLLGHRVQLAAQSGIYASNLKRQQVSTPLHQKNVQISGFQNWDVGIVLAAEQQHFITNKIALSYGIRSTVGFSSILDMTSHRLPNLAIFSRLTYRL